jgi:hypothetical protein
MSVSPATLEIAHTAALDALLVLNGLIRSANDPQGWERASDDSLLEEIEELERAACSQPPVVLPSGLLPVPEAIRVSEHIVCRGTTVSESGLTATCAHRLAIALAARASTCVFQAVLKSNFGDAPPPRDSISRSTRELWKSCSRRHVRDALLALPGFDLERLMAEVDQEYQLGLRSLGEPPTGGQWMPVSDAIVKAAGLGYDIPFSWFTRSADDDGVQTRPQKLPGKHRREVDWTALAAYLFEHGGRWKKKDGPGTSGMSKDLDEPDAEERVGIDARLKAAQERKRRERPTD